jgi:transposase
MEQRTMGIDLGIQSPNVAVVLDERGEEVESKLIFEMSKEEFQRVEQAALSGARDGTKLHVVMEKTFPTCEYVSEYFLGQGHAVSYAKPDQVKEGRKFISRKVKNDVRDAFVMARLPYLDPRQLRRSYVAKPVSRELKTLVSQRLSMVKHLTFLKNQLNRATNAVWPGLTKLLDSLDSNHGRALLREFDAEKVTKLEEAELARFLRERGRIGQAQADRLARGIMRLAKRTMGLRSILKDDQWVELQRNHSVELLEEIESVEKLLKRKEKQIGQAYLKADPEQRFKSVPGVGERTAPTFFTYFGEPERFPSTRKAQGFVGFYPETDASGSNDRKGTALSKAGPGLARRDLFLAADIFRRVDPDGARVYYDQMTHKGKHHTSAVCVVANRVLLPRLVAIGKERRAYEFRDFQGRPITKQEAKELVAQFQVSEEVRARLRSRKKAAKKENRGSESSPVTSELEAPRSGTAPRQENSSSERVSLTKDQLATLVYRNVDRLLNSGGKAEEIGSQLFKQAIEFYEKGA